MFKVQCAIVEVVSAKDGYGDDYNIHKHCRKHSKVSYHIKTDSKHVSDSEMIVGICKDHCETWSEAKFVNEMIRYNRLISCEQIPFKTVDELRTYITKYERDLIDARRVDREQARPDRVKKNLTDFIESRYKILTRDEWISTFLNSIVECETKARST